MSALYMVQRIVDAWWINAKVKNNQRILWLIDWITDWLVGTAGCGWFVSDAMSFLRARSFSLVLRQTSAGWPWQRSQSSRLCPSDGFQRLDVDECESRCERTSSRLRPYGSHTPILLLRHSNEDVSLRLQRLFVNMLTSTALRMTRVNEGSHSFTCHPHAYPQMEWSILRLIPSRSASPHFGRYSFPVPQRVGGRVDFGSRPYTVHYDTIQYDAIYLDDLLRPTEDRRLSWPGRLVTYRGGMSARRRSPIPVSTDR